jgi:hypothetical protein
VECLGNVGVHAGLAEPGVAALGGEWEVAVFHDGVGAGRPIWYNPASSILLATADSLAGVPRSTLAAGASRGDRAAGLDDAASLLAAVLRGAWRRRSYLAAGKRMHQTTAGRLGPGLSMEARQVVQG